MYLNNYLKSFIEYSTEQFNFNFEHADIDNGCINSISTHTSLVRFANRHQNKFKTQKSAF